LKPHQLQEAYEKKRKDEKPEKTTSLKEPSPTTTMCLKKEAT
jgi:hypothetical protein